MLVYRLCLKQFPIDSEWKSLHFCCFWMSFDKFDISRHDRSMKNWVFDLDGTLVDTLDQYSEKLKRVFAYFEIPVTDEVLARARNAFDARKFFSYYLDAADIDRAYQLLQKFSLELAPKAKLFEGVWDLLNFLQSQNVQLSLWTGRDETSTRRILQNCGLDPFFNTCVTGTCVDKKKPDPEGLQKVLELTHAHHADTIMVGDHLFDIQGAKALGIKALSVSWREELTADSNHPLVGLSDGHFYNTSELITWARTKLTEQ